MPSAITIRKLWNRKDGNDPEHLELTITDQAERERETERESMNREKECVQACGSAFIGVKMGAKVSRALVYPRI